MKIYLSNKSYIKILKNIKIKNRIKKKKLVIILKILVVSMIFIRSQLSLNGNNFSKDVFIKNCAKIYNFINKQDDFYIYNRTSNNKQSYDINIYIKELYNTFKS